MDFIRGQNTPYFSWNFDLKYDFGPVKLPCLSRNGALVFSSEWLKKQKNVRVCSEGKGQPISFFCSINYKNMLPSINCIVKFIWNRTKIP